jgi:HK97 family phage prohead protease
LPGKKEFKTLDAKLQLKNTDEDSKYYEFSGYASTFNNVDLYDDAVMPGAFKESLLKKMPKLIYQHNMSQPLGVIDEAYEDDKGLMIKGRMPKAHSLVKDIKELLDCGAIDSFSIGYSTVDSEMRDGTRLLKQLDLWEVSFVTLPANPKATITSVKSIDDIKEEVKTQRDFEKILRESGAFSKDACVYLASCFKSPEEGEPPEGNDGQVDEVKKALTDFNDELSKLIGDLK